VELQVFLEFVKLMEDQLAVMLTAELEELVPVDLE
jgi:hypothetical protein